MYKAVVFDVDGTLLDGTEGIIKSVKSTLEHFNLPPLNDERLLKFVGPPIQNSCKEHLGMSSEEAQEFANYFRHQYASGDVFYARVYDGIFELLDTLKRLNIRMGVATYKRQDYASDLMKHFGFDKYFTSICGADNENKLKKIDIMKNCIAGLRVKKGDVLMVGDSLHDGGASVELNVGFIGVTYGFGFKSKPEIEPYLPICCADSPKEVQEFFEKIYVK